MKLWRVTVYQPNSQPHDGPCSFLTIGEDIYDVLHRLEQVWAHPLPGIGQPIPNQKDILSIIKEADLVI